MRRCLRSTSRCRTRCGAHPRHPIDAVMRRTILMLAFAVGFILGAPAAASHLVTGNGFGFAVVAPESGLATKFYSHPYNFLRPDPANSLSEGIETPNFIKSLRLGKLGQRATAEYVADSQVIQMRDGRAIGTFFMTFGLDRPALIIESDGGIWRTEWSKP